MAFLCNACFTAQHGFSPDMSTPDITWMDGYCDDCEQGQVIIFNIGE